MFNSLSDILPNPDTITGWFIKCSDACDIVGKRIDLMLALYVMADGMRITEISLFNVDGLKFGWTIR
jgi:hypothetical protein